MVIDKMEIEYAKHQIVTPALKRIGLASPSAINLVTGIGLVESGYRTRKQVNGPALGFWQMEPETERDCWVNFLDYRPLLAGLVRKITHPDLPTSSLLLSNDAYAAVMCRIRLYRSSDPLPSADYALALCQYWKLHYNTERGAGQVDQTHVSLFQQAIDT